MLQYDKNKTVRDYVLEVYDEFEEKLKKGIINLYNVMVYKNSINVISFNDNNDKICYRYTINNKSISYSERIVLYDEFYCESTFNDDYVNIWV